MPEFYRRENSLAQLGEGVIYHHRHSPSPSSAKLVFRLWQKIKPNYPLPYGARTSSCNRIAVPYTKLIRILFATLLLFSIPLLLSGCSGAGEHYGKNTKGQLVRPRGLPKAAADQVSERRIVLMRKNGAVERLDLVYFRQGQYDPAAIAAINNLFRDRRTNAIGEIDPELIDYMVDIRTRLGLPPNIEFEVMSGYRSPETNAALAEKSGKVARESLHMQGWAVDFRIPKVNGNAIAEIAKTMQRGGVAYYPDSNHVHVDIGNIRTWGYSATYY